MSVDIYDDDVEILGYDSSRKPDRIKYKGYYWVAENHGGVSVWRQLFPPTPDCSDCLSGGACKRCQAEHYHYQAPKSFQSNNLAFCRVCGGTIPNLSSDESWRISYANQPCPDCAST